MQVWKLYNTKTMDFHLFFCAKKAMELQVSRASRPLLAPCLPACIGLTQPGPALRLPLRTLAPCLAVIKHMARLSMPHSHTVAGLWPVTGGQTCVIVHTGLAAKVKAEHCLQAPPLVGGPSPVPKAIPGLMRGRRSTWRDLIPPAAQALVVADEKEDVTNKGVKLIWEEGKDDWASYALAHMEAIRAKYFPKNVKEAKGKGMVEKALPSAKTVDHLADAAATNAPAGPLKVGSSAAHTSREQKRQWKLLPVVPDLPQHPMRITHEPPA